MTRAFLAGAPELPRTIQVGDEEWDLSHFEERAFQNSGLSFDEWNALSPQTRHTIVRVLIADALRSSDSPLDRDGEGQPGGSLKVHVTPEGAKP